MNILITGSTGPLGQELVRIAQSAGHSVRIGSRFSRPEASPQGRAPNFGGPNIARVGEMAETWMEAMGRDRYMVRLLIPGTTAQAFRKGRNTDPARKEGTITWRQWLDRLSP